MQFLNVASPFQESSTNQGRFALIQVEAKLWQCPLELTDFIRVIIR